MGNYFVHLLLSIKKLNHTSKLKMYWRAAVVGHINYSPSAKIYSSTTVFLSLQSLDVARISSFHVHLHVDIKYILNK